MLRAHAPEQDRGDKALRPAVSPDQPRPESAYVKVHLFARTLDELRTMCGPHGDAAVTDARWQAVSLWLMSDLHKAPALTNPTPVAVTAVCLCRDEDQFRIGLPDWQGRERTSVLNGLSPDSRQEALLVGAETLADWERAGCPCLTPERLKAQHQYIQSCLNALTPNNPDQEPQ